MARGFCAKCGKEVGSFLKPRGWQARAVEETIGKKLVVYAKSGFVSDFPVRLDFSVRDPKQWQGWITSTSKARSESILAEKRKERIQIVFDFSALKEYMVKGGLILQTVKCPHCGAPIKIPQSGNQTTCEYCGNTFMALDIFEKIKSLI